MLADVFDQLGLGIGWSRNENRASGCNRLSDSLKEGVILRGVPAPDGVCLMVDVLSRMIRMQNEPFHIGRAEMEHACLTVIDPNDRMKVMAAHGMSPFGDRILHCAPPREDQCSLCSLLSVFSDARSVWRGHGNALRPSCTKPTRRTFDLQDHRVRAAVRQALKNVAYASSARPRGSAGPIRAKPL
jgi:hypothetical protein